MGSDMVVTNNNGANWVDSKQASVQRSRIYEMRIYNISVATTYVWLFDTAAGSVASTAPVFVWKVAASSSDSLAFPAGGTLFSNGIYVQLSSTAPATIATAPTASGNNAALLKMDIRIG